MGEESKQLEQWRIDHARAALDRDIGILQTKVRHTLDWRYQFEERPLALMGIAFGLGTLLSMIPIARAKH